MNTLVKEETNNNGAPPKICIVCKKEEVIWEHVTEDFEDWFKQADTFGMESLDENMQLVIEGKVCCFDCYMEMD